MVNFFLIFTRKFVTLELTRIELFRAFRLKPDGGPGQRDLTYLMVLLLFITFLSYLILSSKAGLWNNSVNVLLGHLPGYGAPVKIISKPIQEQTLSNEDLSRILDIPGLTFHFYQEVEPYEVTLPGYEPPSLLGNLGGISKKSVWQNRAEGDSNVDVQVRAVYSSDPLWLLNELPEEKTIGYSLTEESLRQVKSKISEEHFSILNQELFILSSENWEDLAGKISSRDVREKLKKLKDKEFLSRNDFYNRLKRILGKQTLRFQDVILSHAQQSIKNRVFLTKEEFLQKVRKKLGKIDPLEEELLLEASRDLTLPLHVILNRSLFSHYFRCDLYREKLEPLLPPSLFQKTVGENSAGLSCLEKGQIWLDLQIGREKELHSFRIFWAKPEFTPALNEVAILFPLTTFHAMKLSKHYPNLVYYPEAEGKGRVQRIKQIGTDFGGRNEKMKQDFFSFARCLGLSDVEAIRNEPQTPWRWEWVKICAEENNIPFNPEDRTDLEGYVFIDIPSKTGHSITHKMGDEINLPCRPLFPGDSYGKKEICSVDTKEKFLNFTAWIYVDETKLLDVIQKLEVLSKEDQFNNIQKTLLIHPDYKKALIRVDYVNLTLDRLTVPYAIIFLLMIGVLLWALVGLFLTHRQATFAIFLAKGMHQKKLRNIIMLQLGTCGIIGQGIAYLAIAFVSLVFNWFQKSTSQSYGEHIMLSDQNLLPFLQWYHLYDSILILVLLILVIYVKLKRMPDETASLLNT